MGNQGVALYENTSVAKIHKIRDGFQVHTTRGEVNAREVIVATNGYTDRMVKELKPKEFPVGSYIIVTEPLSQEMQDTLSPKQRMYYDSKNFQDIINSTISVSL